MDQNKRYRRRPPTRGAGKGAPRGGSHLRSTSWEPLAQWYEGWSGKDGSLHHQKLAIPAVIKLLDLQKTDSVLDLGCGHGVLTKSVTQTGARYTGLDLSPTLIQQAKRTHRAGTFLVQDARTLKPNDLGHLPALPNKAVFLLSIQDMDPLLPIFSAVANCLQPTGRIVILMTHPAFRIPRQSGWGYDEQRKLTYRRVDSYLGEMQIPLKPFENQKGVSKSYHRPLKEYVNLLGESGFAIDAMDEIATFKQEQAGNDQAKSINRAYKEIPLFLALRAVRIQS